jgi:hypothetical protein
VGEDGQVPTRVVLSLVAVLGLVLVLVVGLSRPSYTVGGTAVTCPDRSFSAAAKGLLDEERDPCTAQAQERLFAVAASLMGLVLISGLLSRRRD